jgi:alkylation response protein AidB-like acyl-CoA dehydrogenase
MDDTALVAASRAWQRRKAEAGFAGILWPEAIGGRGGTPIQAAIFAQEEAAYDVPTGVFLQIGMNMAVPVIVAHGTAEQSARFARPTLRGEMTWCQLFSEPSAGSDLAALRTKATREGDGWRINGQKLWSSWAHHADFGILLARTDPALPKHKGLTFFVLDMRSPGITIRPIRQISGKSEFNEVFLDNVPIPDTNRIGRIGEGWACAMTTLVSERAVSGGGDENDLDVATVLGALRNAPGVLDGTAIVRLARWRAIERGIENFRYRLLTRLSRGESLGADAAMVKLAYGRKLQDLAAFTMDAQGFAGLAAGAGEEFKQLVFEAYQWGAVMRIAGGTDEILRNQLAERVLGMPGEIRLDRDIPFEQLGA